MAFGGALGEEAVVWNGMGRGQVGQMGSPAVLHILGSGSLGNPGNYQSREMQTAPYWECSAKQKSVEQLQTCFKLKHPIVEGFKNVVFGDSSLPGHLYTWLKISLPIEMVSL